MEWKDFYCEPSESDIAIQELKEHLKKEVKSEILNKLEKLEKENKELQEIKKNKEKLENDYKEKFNQLEREYQIKERTLYQKPLKELIEIIQEEYYYVSYDYLEKPKCSKCNDKRQLEILDDYGRKHYVNCVCKETYKSKYLVKPKYIGIITEISKRDEKLKMWVSFSYAKSSWNKEDAYISGTYFDKDSIVYDYDKFIEENIKNIKERIKKDYSFSNYTFSKKEDAQKFADFVNDYKEN